MTEDATREWLPVHFFKKEHWKLILSACHWQYISWINVLRLITDCAFTVTEEINAIYFLKKLTKTGMSQSPLQKLGGIANLPGGSTLTSTSGSESDASLLASVSPGPDDAAGTSSARKRSTRFSRAFAITPVAAASIAKAKPTSAGPMKPNALALISPVTEYAPTDSDSSDISKTTPVMSGISPLNRGLVTGTENGEFEYLRIKTCQRSASLKSQISPPGTPRRKKAVRFADALGLDLASVRQIMDSDDSPQIPDTTMRNVVMRSYDPWELTEDCYLMPLFSQPACLPNFFSVVKISKVLLENCLIHDGCHPSISGTVRVSNIGYYKEVIIHYTIDRWTSHEDLEATYVPNSSDGQTDRFSFHIILPSNFKPGSRLEMAVMYTVNGQTFWDNNHSKNYVVECYGHIETDDPGWLHFF